MPGRVLQIVGYKNSGKTALMEQWVTRLARNGRKVGTIKHDAHQFETDHPGTDSWRHRKAGALMSAVTSDQRSALIREQPVSLEDMLQEMASMDVVLVEGFKQARYPKIVIIRTFEERELALRLDHVIAVVSWHVDAQFPYPHYSIADTDRLFRWLEAHFFG